MHPKELAEYEKALQNTNEDIGNQDSESKIIVNPGIAQGNVIIIEEALYPKAHSWYIYFTLILHILLLISSNWSKIKLLFLKSFQ